MISVVIPTLQKNIKLLNALLANLEKDEAVGEILIIDNTLKGFDNVYKKVKVIIPEENIFVNPAWNLGVSESKYDYVALFNDDVLVSDSFCKKIMPYLSENNGLIGSLGYTIKCIKDDLMYAPIEDKALKISPVDAIINGFGVIMIGHKNAFPHIPEIMKVYGGDEYLFKINENNNKQNYVVYGLEMRHYGSLASANPKLKDMEDFNEKDFRDNFNPESKLTFINKLFSVKRDGIHYVIRFLGLKFKIRKKLGKS